MNIEQQIAKMTDAQLAEVCGGDEPPRRMNLKDVMQQKRVDVMTDFLQHVVGEDINRGGLLETPERAVKAWQLWTCGYQQDPADLLKVFEDGAEGYSEAVGVFNIPFYSHCEHHLAPIIGHASVAYIPDGKIVGLSKLNRIVECFARRLQVQERMTNQIATAIWENLNPRGVAVWVKARHLCMESRGICQQGHHTITQSFRGAHYGPGKPDRLEFLAQCR